MCCVPRGHALHLSFGLFEVNAEMHSRLFPSLQVQRLTGSPTPILLLSRIDMQHASDEPSWGIQPVPVTFVCLPPCSVLTHHMQVWMLELQLL